MKRWIAGLVVVFDGGGCGNVWGAIQYTVTDLGSLGGGSSVGLDINNSGQVTGYSTLPSGATHAFLYSGGVMTDLGTLGGTEEPWTQH